MARLLAVNDKKLKELETLFAGNSLNRIDELSEDTGSQVDLELLSSLEKIALERYESATNNELDAWLAPRIHYSIRISRSLAACPGVWAWLAVRVFPKYMDRRWPRAGEEEKSLWRYNSRDMMRNGISRLWWGAEMVRSGPRYTVVDKAFKSVRTFMFVSELRYSWHREATRAFARVLFDKKASDENALRLSKIFNVYLKTHALEQWDPHAESTCEFDKVWGAGKPTIGDIKGPTNELVGPKTGVSRHEVENHLFKWLVELYKDLSTK